MLCARLPSIPFEGKDILMIVSASVPLYIKGLSQAVALQGRNGALTVLSLLLLL